MTSRIITRPDFDGVVCAVLLKEALGGDLPVCWVQPNQIQNGEVTIGKQDIIANLPIYGKCALWFDHHVSNTIEREHEGLFRIAPSAAGLVYEYFQNIIDKRFQELVQQADKIDSAQLNLDEILHPERYGYILVSMTISAEQGADQHYWNHLTNLLKGLSIEQVLADTLVKERCKQVILDNATYRTHLKNHTRTQGKVSVTDFRGLSPVPNGNRFLVYSLFPETVVNIKIFHEKDRTALKIGHSILNRNCMVNVGRLLAKYGGGGHRGAGACRLSNQEADRCLSEILTIMAQNKAEK
jgi:oligoribonuclease NrnB/cAMP/cGMP phosphodiesterase (DHH superfamily)